MGKKLEYQVGEQTLMPFIEEIHREEIEFEQKTIKKMVYLTLGACIFGVVIPYIKDINNFIGSTIVNHFK